jgi:signal transduction histidine kinase
MFPSNFLRDRRGRGGGGDRNRWTLSAWHRDGSLEAAVATARWRNLAVASLLLALILASGLALLRFTRQSHEAAEAERRFFAGVSHELRTPLTAIRAAGQNLQDNIVREEAQKQQYIGIIVRHAEQLSDIVDQVLHYAAASKSHAQPQGSVDLASVIASAREAAGLEIRGAKCELELDVPDSLPPVQGDASALRRLFQNLIGNAARHGGDGRSIRIEASELQGFVEVKVMDRGPGIPGDELPRIFDAFFRGARARSKQTRGAGIGLSLVHEIAGAHGGKVTASNRKGGGAVFTVQLPIAVEEATP